MQIYRSMVWHQILGQLLMTFLFLLILILSYGLSEVALLVMYRESLNISTEFTEYHFE